MKLNWTSAVQHWFVRVSGLCLILNKRTLITSAGPHGRQMRCRSTLAGVAIFASPLREPVLFYDEQSEQVRPETDDRWIIAAALSAVEKYPELRVILPQQPSTAATCATCSGTGRLLDTSVHCGTCFGLGWVS
jgi:hypothetical protein